MGAFVSPLGFFGIGDTEMLVIMVAILIFFGGKRMPELARGLGKALREFKRATSEVEQEFRRVMEEAENPPAPLPTYTPAPEALPAATEVPPPTPGHELLPAAGEEHPKTAESPPEAQPAPKPAEPGMPEEFHSDV